MAFSFRAGTNWCHDFPKLARESGFHFNMHRRRVRVDWNRISSIDVERVVADRDFMTIDDNVNNVVDYCLESEYDVKILDPNFVKLFRLAQLAVEYLLYCKQYLDRSVVILKEELRAERDENLRFKNEAGVNEKIIEELRDKLKERRRIIETKLSDSHGEIHKCPQCPKTFVSALFMSAHVNRRHPNVSRTSAGSPAREDYRAETEKLHSEIKSLKERLNLTERVIRNESERFLSSDSVVSNDNRDTTRLNEKNNSRINRDRDEIIEAQHRRYQQEIGNLKETLFDEIRNLKSLDRYSRGKSDNEDCNNASIKELIREQENEIRRLRQEICAKNAEIVPEAEAKRENPDELWRSKMENLELRYRADIEKLYAQLRKTQESSDRMRLDYTTRISDLELRDSSLYNRAESPNHARSTLLRASEISHLEISDFSKKPAKSTIEFEPMKNQRVPSDAESSGNDSSDVSSGNVKNRKIMKKRAIDDEKITKSSFVKFSREPRRRERKSREITPTGRNEAETAKKNEAKIEKMKFRENLLNYEIEDPSVTNLRATGEKLANRVAAREAREGKIEKTIIESDRSRNSDEISMKKVNDAGGFVETRRNVAERDKSKYSSDEDSESWTDSESLDDDSSLNDEPERKFVDTENLSNSRVRRYGEEKKSNFEIHAACDGLEIFQAKLREFGIDPEWQGIPDATLAQVLEILRHHRNINSKKYPKFEDTRRKILQQLSRMISIREKDGGIDDSNERSQLEKLVTNVRSKVSKAFNILEKNDGAHATRRATSKFRLHSEKPVAQKFHRNLKSGKEAAAPRRENAMKKNSNDRESSISDDISCDDRSAIIEQVTSHDRAAVDFSKNHATEAITSENRRSQASIENLTRDTNQRIVKTMKIASGDLVASTPQRTVKISSFDDSTNAASSSAIRMIGQRENSLAPSIDSPARKNGKSVLKTTTIGGSIGSLTKKKVLFDLESPEKAVTKIERGSVDPSNDKESIFRNERDTSESDFEISSIHEERADEGKNDSPQSGKAVLLKTAQSEKIARISQQIEQQLSIARRKPAGAVEAMFMEKFKLGNENDDESTLNFRFIDKKKNSTDATWKNRESKFSKAGDDENDEKDENLEMDIDELLLME